MSDEIFCGHCAEYNYRAPAKFELRNGEEIDYLCEICFKDTVFDMVMDNKRMEITEQGERNGLKVFSL
jgi:hypothetical protein